MNRNSKQKNRLEWAHHEFETLVGRKWPEREFDKLGYLKIKGAKLLDPASLAVLRELYLTRDARAQEIDRPPFKVLGNRTLLELAREKTTDPKQLVRIKGVTELILRRMGDSLIQAIARGLETPHGPIPKQPSTNVRRRMDRQMEKRLTRLKGWRQVRSKELELDPGVLAPNACLEALTIAKPSSLEALSETPGIKKWFAQSFGLEILDLLANEANDQNDSESTEAKPRKRSAASKKRRRRKSSASSNASDSSESDTDSTK